MHDGAYREEVMSGVARQYIKQSASLRQEQDGFAQAFSSWISRLESSHFHTNAVVANTVCHTASKLRSQVSSILRHFCLMYSKYHGI